VSRFTISASRADNRSVRRASLRSLTAGQLTSVRTPIPGSTPCLQVDEVFRGNAQLRSLVVALGDDEVGLLNRAPFYQALTGRLGFGWALHHRSAVARLVGHAEEAVPASTPVVELALRLLDEGATASADDVLVRFDDGQVGTVPAVAVFDELSREVAAQNEHLREHDRLKDSFVATVSHELRTPLTSILGYIELARESESSAMPVGPYLDVVERNAARLTRLVGDLLTVAQLDQGLVTVDPAAVDLAMVARNALLYAEPAAAEHGIELVLLAPDDLTIMGDQTRLAQLLDNLVSNAIKFTPDGGRVEVRLVADEECAAIEVADEGIGIAPDETAKLFERFFRTRDAERRAIRGTGLGLAIAKAIVDAHGGTIDVTSALGVGTTFRVELPRCPVAVESRAA
jgi:signal transduction histidine kinase